MSEQSEVWNVRFEVVSGGYTFTRITRRGNPVPREEVEEWADTQVRVNDWYVAVDDIYAVDESK